MEHKENSFKFLQEAQVSLAAVLNERQANLQFITEETVEEALSKLLLCWNDLQVETLGTHEFKAALEAQKIFLTLSLVFQTEFTESEVVETDHAYEDTVDTVENPIAYEDTVESPIAYEETVEYPNAYEETVEYPNAYEDTVENHIAYEYTADTVENTIAYEDTADAFENPIADTRTDDKDSLDILSFLTSELQRLSDALNEIQSAQSNVIKNINITRRLKQQLLLVSLIYFCYTGKVPSLLELAAKFFTKEDAFSALNGIVPRAYNYNIYMIHYRSFLHTFVTEIESNKFQSLMSQSLSRVETQFPQCSLPQRLSQSFAILNLLTKIFGCESYTLKDCCNRIETRASVLAIEGPLDASQKMYKLWLLLDAFKFLTFDDNFMAIYVFSNDISFFHEQLMRIFYVINRIDEAVREIGYLAFATETFVSHYQLVYTELHGMFSKLIRALNRNYEIVEIECDETTGAIRPKTESSGFIMEKLTELCIQMTMPLACLDSIIRLSLERSDIPILFGEIEEKFIFTAPVSSILMLHDFIASDREKFAEFMVELYPCLERHFSRFHKSKAKQSVSQGPNTALPPSYHLFAAEKPPTYDNINIVVDMPNTDPFAIQEDSAPSKCCKCFAPISGFVLLFLFLAICLIYFFNQ